MRRIELIIVFMVNRLLIIAVLTLLFSGCTKYEEEIVPGNVAPPDGTVDNITIENYINKVYIAVLGREPEPAEFAAADTMLKASEAAMADRNTFVNSVLQSDEYNERLYTLARQEYLENVDTADIPFFISLYEPLLLDSTYFPFWDLIEMEIQRFQDLLDIPDGLASGSLTVIDLHKRCCNNEFYDEINMGSLNFVVSVFQNFLDRYPSDSELEEGIKMVDGLSASLFLTLGDSKDDFLDIFFNSTDYFEGQVRFLYLKYLFRDPTSAEMSIKAIEYKQSKDFKALQRSILTTDEYLGIN